jgi:ActR/RegA family two-component response regulator
MHHILILDDNEYFAKQLERIVDGFDNREESSIELAFTSDQAITLAKSSSQIGNRFFWWIKGWGQAWMVLTQ